MACRADLGGGAAAYCPEILPDEFATCVQSCNWATIDGDLYNWCVANCEQQIAHLCFGGLLQ